MGGRLNLDGWTLTLDGGTHPPYNLSTACNINQHLKKRMQNNDISDIINMKRLDISPAVYHMLQNSQPTSASAARSFSKLKKLLAKHKNFMAKNVRYYMILHFNASTW